jgi:hypothetical protein
MEWNRLERCEQRLGEEPEKFTFPISDTFPPRNTPSRRRTFHAPHCRYCNTPV